MEEWDAPVLETGVAILLLLGGIRVALLQLNKETGRFYFLVGSEFFRWSETGAGGQDLVIPMPAEQKVKILGIILALLLLTGQAHVASVLFNREVGLFYFGVGSEFFRWKSAAS